MTSEKKVYQDPSQLIDNRVEDLLKRMTIEEKVAQLRAGWPMCYGYRKRDEKVEMVEELKAALTKVAIGHLAGLLRADPWVGITLEMGLSRRQGAEIVNTIQRHIKENTRLGIPVLIGDDGNHGQLGIGATVFPALCAIGCSWNPDLHEAMAHAMAAEMRAQGQTVLFAPDLDVLRDPRWGRSDQNYGEDPYHVSRMGCAMVRGLQGESLATDHSVVALLRAYPGLGDAEGGHDFTGVHLGLREMHQVVLRPWKEAIREGAQGVMVEVADYDGILAPGSHYYVTELLRDEWGFQGMAMGDAGAVMALLRRRVARSKLEAAVLALKAGLDQNETDFRLGGDSGESDRAYADGIPQALKRGLVSIEEIDRSVRRVLRLKFLLGLFENPFVDPEKAQAVARCAEHRKLALETARQSIVLLKNMNGILPFGGDLESIAVIGPNADNSWNQLGDQAPSHSREHVVTILDGITSRSAKDGITVHYARGCGIRERSKKGFTEAVQAAKKSDIVVAVMGSSSEIRYPRAGEHHGDRSEEADCGENVARATLDLLGMQEELLKALKETGKPLVVVLIHGRAMSINWVAENADAIVDAWYPGDQGGTAVAEVLFGDYNPGGKLPVSVPRHVGQLPVYYYSHLKRRPDYTDMSSQPLYTFGFGLSYTSFSYANLTIEPDVIPIDGKAAVSVEVSNTGGRAGDEVVQLYIRDEVSSTVRSYKELKGFSRMNLKAGETKRVTFQVGWEELCFCGPDLRWIVEPGVFTVMVGSSSEDLPLGGFLTVKE